MDIDNSYESVLPKNYVLNLQKSDSLDELSEPEVVIDEDGTMSIFDKSADFEDSEERVFDDNLAMFFDIEYLEDLADDLMVKYESDKEAREPRDRMCKKGYERAGLDDMASPPSADFEGSSNVVHPMLTEGAIDFALRSIKELCPPTGIVKGHILGEATNKKVEQSQHKVDGLNYLLLYLMPYRYVMQQNLTQLPFTGAQFIKFWHDPYLKRPNCEFLPMDHVYIPYACNDFYNADRVTIRMKLTPVEYWRRVKSDIYYDEEYLESLKDSDDTLFPPKGGSDVETKSKTDEVKDKIDGKTDLDDDEAFTIFEIYTYLSIPKDKETKGDYAPYIVIVKQKDARVIGLYRNWNQEDKKRKKIDYIVKTEFIPWDDAFGLGFAQLIGSLSGAATGALRALLDAAHINNRPSAMGLKGIKMSGQSPDIGIGRINFFEGPNGMDDDIRKCIMQLPFNPPSQVLFDLLQFLTSQGSEIIKVPNNLNDSMGNRTPANTALAMIEQTSNIQSAIYTNLHFAQMKCFEIIGNLIYKHFDADGYPDYFLEDYKFSKEMFAHTRDIIPVSDPNIFTEVQRYAQLEAIMNMANADPTKFNKDEIYKRMLVLIKVPQPELLLNTPQATYKANAVAENASIMLGSNIEVYPDQDHLAHLFVHLSFLKSPILGGNQAFNQNTPQMIAHIKEHLTLFYVQLYQQQLKNESNIESFNIFDEDTGLFDDKLREITPDVLGYLEKELSTYIPEAQQILNQLMQLQSQQAQQNMQPDQIKLEIEKTKLQQAQSSLQATQQTNSLKGQETQAKMTLEQQKMQNDQKSDEMKLQLEQMKAQSQERIAELELIAEQKESNASIEVEKLRLEKERLDHLNQLELQLLKHKEEMQLEALKHGHELGARAFEHTAQLKHDREKHDKDLEVQSKSIKNNASNDK